MVTATHTGVNGHAADKKVPRFKPREPELGERHLRIDPLEDLGDEEIAAPIPSPSPKKAVTPKPTGGVNGHALANDNKSTHGTTTACQIRLRFKDQHSVELDASALGDADFAAIAEQAGEDEFKGKTATLSADGLADWKLETQANYWTLWKLLHEGRDVHLFMDKAKYGTPIEVALAMLLGAEASKKKFQERLRSAAQVVRLTCDADDRAAQVDRLVQRLKELGAKTDHKDKLLHLVNKGVRKSMRGGGQTGEEGGCIVTYWFTENGERRARPITNFTARILRRISEDDESGQAKRKYEIKVTDADGAEETIEVPVADFDGMGWLKELDRAFVYIEGSQGTANQVRATICRLSGKPPSRRVYTHTGWRKHKKGWVFLHAGGAIGADGPVKGVRVRLEESLADYDLLRMPKKSKAWDGKIVTGTQLKTAIRASLDILKVAPYRLTVPLLGVTFRAVLGNADFTAFYFGQTGKLKTALTALAQQHFGHALDNENIPFSAESTSYANQELLYLAKDMVALVDDYVEAGTPADIQRARREMGRTLRAKGNRQGRTRLRSDSTIRKGRPPRALPIYTGEQHSTVQSVLARAINLEVHDGDVRVDRLTKSQEHGAAGLFAQTMAAFIKDIAGCHTEVMQQVKEMKNTYRAKIQQMDQHKRTSTTIADLHVGFKLFLRFAEKKGAITAEERLDYVKKGWKALTGLVEGQKQLQRASNPADRLIELLRSAVQSGRAYVADLKGECPDKAIPGAHGWQRNEKFFAPAYGARKIGWVDGPSLYLEPRVAVQVAESMLSRTEDQLGIGTDDMGRKLLDQNYLHSDGLTTSQKRIMIRKTVEDKQVVSVYDLKRSAIIALEHSASIPEIDDEDDEDGDMNEPKDVGDGAVEEEGEPADDEDEETTAAKNSGKKSA